MKRYVEQLLEDIEVAQNNADKAIAKWESINENNHPDDFFDPQPEDGILLCDLFGLQRYFLPADSYLDDEEIQILVLSISQLWRAHGLIPVFTKNLPKRIKYNLLRDYWNQRVFPNPGEKVDIELCDYENCPYCDGCPVCPRQHG
jgi:hypothetical protein